MPAEITTLNRIVRRAHASDVATSLSEPNAATQPPSIVRYAWIAIIWSLLLGPITISFHRSDVVVYAVHITVLAIGAGAILLALFHPGPLRYGAAIWLGLLALAFGPFLSGFFGINPTLTPDILRLLVVFTAVFLLQPAPLIWFVNHCKAAIATYTLITVAAVIVAPTRVLQSDYAVSWMPALPFRLQGIAGDSNNFAALLVVYLVLCWITPPRTIPQWSLQILTIGCLVATQSKTVVFALAAIYMVWLIYARGVQRLVVAYGLAIALVTLLIVITIRTPSWSDGFVDRLIADDQFTTLTGRTDLWVYTLDVWRSNPVFGYGPSLWNPEMAREYQFSFGWAPSHAHNQIVQTLGESGILGLAGLIMFLLILCYKAVRFGRFTNGAAPALVVFLLVRGISEPPVRMLLAETFFVLFITYTLMIVADAAYSVTTRTPARAGEALDHRAAPLTSDTQPSMNPRLRREVMGA